MGESERTGESLGGRSSQISFFEARALIPWLMLELWLLPAKILTTKPMKEKANPCSEPHAKWDAWSRKCGFFAVSRLSPLHSSPKPTEAMLLQKA